MSGVLGYGGTLPLLLSVRSAEASTTIEEGEFAGFFRSPTIPLSGDNMVNTSGGSTDSNFASGSQIVEAVRVDNAVGTLKALIGPAYNDIAPGEDGHVVLWGHTRVKSGAAVTLHDSLTVSGFRAVKGAIAAGAGDDMCGIAREAAAGANELIYALISMTHNPNDSAGFGGTDA